MAFWLARAAKSAREAAGRKQVHVAASANKDQSTIYRFEQGTAWPQDTDLLIAAYADDLEIDPQDIWQMALDMWKESGSSASVSELEERRAARTASRSDGKKKTPKRRAAVAAELTADMSGEAQRTRAQGASGKRTRRAPKASSQ